MSWLFRGPVVIIKEIISWLLKDSINSDLAQFHYAQSNSKKWPKGHLVFLRPNCCKCFFMYLLAPFIQQNLKKILRANPELWRCANFGPEIAHLSWIIFLVKTIVITFICLLALFTVQNFKKILQRIQSYVDAPFWAQNDPFAPNKFSVGKLLISFSSTY